MNNLQSASFEGDGLPRATVTRSGTRLSCVIDHIDGLEPTRTVSAEEAAAGIDSLDPPTVRAASPRDLIDLAARATSSALESTVGELSAPDVALCNYYVAVAVKSALEKLGYAI